MLSHDVFATSSMGDGWFDVNNMWVHVMEWMGYMSLYSSLLSLRTENKGNSSNFSNEVKTVWGKIVEM